MESNALTAGIIGLDKQGHILLEAAQATGAYEIVAVADQDHQHVEKVATELQCQAYTDYRQLIVQNHLDCLLVAADIHVCDDHLKTAIKKKFNVLKLAPPARDYEEALELVQMAESEKVRLAIANPGRFKSSYGKAHELISQGHIDQIFLITAYCGVSPADRPSWCTDPKLAGGGVLLHHCHQVIDQILWNFSIPQQVYALHTNHAPDKQQRLYLTEDTAVVCLKFTHDLTGTVTATRRSNIGPDETLLKIYGKDALLTVTDNQVTLGTTTEPEQTWQYDDDEHIVMERLLASFAQSVRDPDEGAFASSAAENLQNMAVFESAYLSARTGFPEEPARILQITRNPSGTSATI